MTLEITTRDGPVPVLELEGRVDTNTSHELEEALQGHLTTATNGLVMDFSAVEYISSAGLRVVLMTVKKLDTRSGGLVLCGMNEHVREVFDIAGFSRMLNIHADQSAALRHLGVRELAVADPSEVLSRLLEVKPVTCTPPDPKQTLAVAKVLGVTLQSSPEAKVARPPDDIPAEVMADNPNPVLQVFQQLRDKVTDWIKQLRKRP